MVSKDIIKSIIDRKLNMNANSDIIISDNIQQSLSKESNQIENEENTDENIKPWESEIESDVLHRSTERVRLNLDHLRNIIYQLGLIKLCWPNVHHSIFEERENFPESYVTNNDKEKLLLLYSENFRLQFCNKYPYRKPLFLACENECGIQVRTFIL